MQFNSHPFIAGVFKISISIGKIMLGTSKIFFLEISTKLVYKIDFSTSYLHILVLNLLLYFI